MKKTRIIAAALAAVMTMSMAATFSASADNTSSLNWFEQIVEQCKEQAKPKKKRLIQMHEFEIERMVKRDYNMTITQYYEVVSRVANTYIYSLYIEQLEIQIRDGMEREARYNCIPTWNEDMIRFMKDYWDELREAAWDWLETNKNN